jgi:hypothetical protein
MAWEPHDWDGDREPWDIESARAWALDPPRTALTEPPIEGWMCPICRRVEQRTRFLHLNYPEGYEPPGLRCTGQPLRVRIIPARIEDGRDEADFTAWWCPGCRFLVDGPGDGHLGSYSRPAMLPGCDAAAPVGVRIEAG